MKSYVTCENNLITVRFCNPVDEQEIKEIGESILSTLGANPTQKKYLFLADMGFGVGFSGPALAELQGFVKQYEQYIEKSAIVICDPAYAKIAELMLQRNGIVNFSLFGTIHDALSYLR